MRIPKSKTLGSRTLGSRTFGLKAFLSELWDTLLDVRGVTVQRLSWREALQEAWRAAPGILLERFVGCVVLAVVLMLVGLALVGFFLLRSAGDL